jgi:hypothetical protein
MDPTVDQEQLHTRVSQELQTYLHKGIADYLPAGRMLAFCLIGALLGLSGSLLVRRANVEASKRPEAAWVQHSLNAVQAAWQAPPRARKLAPVSVSPSHEMPVQEMTPAQAPPQAMPEPRAANLASLKLDAPQPQPVAAPVTPQQASPRAAIARRPSKDASHLAATARAPGAARSSQGLLIPPLAHPLAQPVAPTPRAEHGLLIPPNFASTLP